MVNVSICEMVVIWCIAIAAVVVITVIEICKERKRSEPKDTYYVYGGKDDGFIQL
jgi:hypothetical protein